LSLSSVNKFIADASLFTAVSPVSLKVPPTHRPYHRPTWSVMRSR